MWQALAKGADSTVPQMKNLCGTQPGIGQDVMTLGVCYNVLSCNGVEMSIKASIDGAGDPSSQSIHHLSTKADRLPDCDDLQGIGNTISAACPAPPAGAYVPTVCTLECAAHYNPWYKQCSAGDDIKALNRQSDDAFASFYEKCESGTAITLSGSSSGCKAHQYAFDDTVYHVAGHLQGKPYWSHRVQYFVYWSDSEGDTLSAGHSRWYLDNDTENDGYMAHSSELSGTVQSNAEPPSATWRRYDSAHQEWKDAEFSFSVDDNGNLDVTVPADDNLYDLISGKTFTRVPGTLNGKRVWTLIVYQHSLYYDETDSGLAPAWEVNFEDGGASKSVFEQLVDEAKDDTMALGIDCGNRGPEPCNDYPPLGTHDWYVFCTHGEGAEKHSITADGGSVLVVMDSSGH